MPGRIGRSQRLLQPRRRFRACWTRGTGADPQSVGPRESLTEAVRGSERRRPLALTNAERQRRYRERRAAGVPVEPAPRPRPKTRPVRWAAALAELRTLQAEYEAWRDQLPDNLAGSRTSELLDEVCDVDLEAVDVELPRGFGRD